MMNPFFHGKSLLKSSQNACSDFLQLEPNFLLNKELTWPRAFIHTGLIVESQDVFKERNERRQHIFGKIRSRAEFDRS